jgi:aryl-alcohol dehydrogenase-like predicted oxidoreductase
MTMTQFALRWILMFDAVTCAIPGGKRPAQVEENCAASERPALSGEAMEEVRRVYEGRIKSGVHQLW